MIYRCHPLFSMTKLILHYKYAKEKKTCYAILQNPELYTFKEWFNNGNDNIAFNINELSSTLSIPHAFECQ